MAGRIGWTLACLMIAPAAAQAQVEPGQWETTVTVDSVDMPGAPPQMARMMGGKTTRSSYCLTPEQASKGPQELLKQNQSCRFTHYSMTGGRISTEMSCSQNGGTLIARSEGSYTPTSMKVSSVAQMSGKMEMRMSSSMTGRRIGACAGK